MFLISKGEILNVIDLTTKSYTKVSTKNIRDFFGVLYRKSSMIFTIHMP